MSEQALILADAGCDFILLEMMYDPRLISVTLDAALDADLPIWFGLSSRRGADGRLLSFDSRSDTPLELVVSMIPAVVDVSGVMHTTAETISPSIEMVRRTHAGPLMAYPESGYFKQPDWQFVDIITPEQFQGFVEVWITAGVQVIGGCCGLGPEHIAAAAEMMSRR